jgi:lipopolysaccharide transport system ATP-binding protein
MSSDTAIRVEHLSKCYQIYSKPSDRLKQFLIPGKRYYREFWALTDISLDIKKGETVGIIGRNGSGKSTLLQMICGTLNPSQGEIQTYGRIAALLELGSGFNPEFTGRENVYLNAAVLGLTERETTERFQAILDFSEIGDFIDQPVKTYSSGMFVRLAFAVIAHVDAQILVVDEALAVGDIYFTQKCMRFLAEFKRHGTILFVTHDTSTVLSLCDRAVLLRKGRLVAVGQAKEVCEAYLHDSYAVDPSTPGTSTEKATRRFTPVDQEPDVRRDLTFNSTLRNDLEVFHFNEASAQLASGNVEIFDATLRNVDSSSGWFVGGEITELRIQAAARTPVTDIIVGFTVKDKLGQHLFGDNTFLRFAGQPVSANTDEVISALFTFRMPIMPSGDYSVAIAVASGTHSNHKIHHWIHDALVFRSHTDSVATGLVGIPMISIQLDAHE